MNPVFYNNTCFDTSAYGLYFRTCSSADVQNLKSAAMPLIMTTADRGFEASGYVEW